MTGDEKFDLSPRTKKWLNRFNNLQLDSHVINIQDDSFYTEDGIYIFKNSLSNFFIGYRFDFSLDFNNKIDGKLRSDEDFKRFTIESRKIWEDEYKSAELEYFTIAISKLMKRRLYDLQLRASFHLSFAQNSCNFSVPGSGKTSIVYAAYSYLKSEHVPQEKRINKLFIVGPPSSFRPWENEFFECFGYPGNIFRLSAEVNREEKINNLIGVNENDFDIYLITYQSVKNYKSEIKRFFKKNKVMFVCDEAHKFKKRDGEWADSILNLAKYARSRVVLTGTPAPNGYQDLYNLFRFIYPENDIIKFRHQALIKITTNRNPNDIEALIENIKPFFVRIKKNDLNLPPVNDEKILSELDEYEKIVYNKLKDILLNSNDDGKKQSIFLRKIQAVNNLHLLGKAINPSEFEIEEIQSQITSLEKILDNDTVNLIKNLNNEYFPSKFYTILKLVKSMAKKGQKVIIWGVFIDSIKRLDLFLKKNGFNGDYVIGETKKSKETTIKNSNYSYDIDSREDLIDKFLNSNSNYIISNPVVLGESISLHKKCHNAIYFELNYAAAPYIQSRDRIHRVWLKDDRQVKYETNYYHIISKAVVDEAIYNRIQEKFIDMLEIIDHDIPFFPNDDESERDLIIKRIIDVYRNS